MIYGFNEPAKQELLALYVNQLFHGSGIAKEFVQEFIRWCDTTRPIEVGVVEDNERAQQFYKKMGFVAVSGAKREFNAYLTEIVMMR